MTDSEQAAKQEPKGRGLDIALAKAQGYVVRRKANRSQTWVLVGPGGKAASPAVSGRVNGKPIGEGQAWGYLAPPYRRECWELLQTMRMDAALWEAFVADMGRRFSDVEAMTRALSPEVICQAALRAMRQRASVGEEVSDGA